MKRLRLIPACLALLLTACSEKEMDRPAPDTGQTASLRISLSADFRNEVVGVKAEPVEEISEDDFWIELFYLKDNSNPRRIYCEKYADAKNAVLDVNTGNYRLLAKHGDSLGIGFDKPFYMAETPFVVEQKKENSVSAVAKLSNVKTKVVFNENLLNTNYYRDCYAVIKNTRFKKTLKFESEETRYGYIPGGELEFFVYIMDFDGKLKYYPVAAKEYKPNDFVTFNVSADERYGDLKVTITTDDTLNETEESVSIPAVEALPATPPAVTVSEDFDESLDYQITEGDDTVNDDLQLTVKSQENIVSLLVETESALPGLPASFDLMSLDDATKAKLEELGFVWYIASTNTAASLDLVNVANHIAWNMPYDGTEETEKSTFKLTATDALGKTDEKTVSITWNLSSKSEIFVNGYDVWATSIKAPVVEFSKGDPKFSTLEYSQDGTSWTSLGRPVSVKGNQAVFKNAEGLMPGTECRFRVVYKKNFFPRGAAAYTTEEAQQLGNSGFEEWTNNELKYTATSLGIFSSEYTCKWYQPFSGAEDRWWDVNSRKTMNTDGVSTEYQEFKVAPTVYSSTDCAEGGSSALLLTTAVSKNASDLGLSGTQSQAAGEIFIGTANDDGSHKTEGHAFGSRPISMSFKYKFLAYKVNSFHVLIELKDADGNPIASKDFVGGTVSDSWEDMDLALDYSDTGRKAASIYVCIRTTSKADADVEYRKLTLSDLDVSVPSGVKEAYVGNILYIDDLKLNY